MKRLLLLFLMLVPVLCIMADDADTVHALQNIDILGQRKDFGVKSSQASAVVVPLAAVKSQTAFFGESDVMKTLQALPGVTQGVEGKSGIYVRGGDYDQNLILFGGCPMLNSEHLSGFLSTINTDILGDVAFYKGAFPAMYGGRLSSIIDLDIQQGSFERYNAQATIGVLSSKVQVDGPIARGRTSFNIAARASYFNWIAMPILNKVVDNQGTLDTYANMNFYDVSANVVHKLSGNDKLVFTGFYGHDTNDDAPGNSRYSYSYPVEFDEKGSPTVERQLSGQYDQGTENHWTNMLASLRLTHRFGKTLDSDYSISYSGYNYMSHYFNNSYSQDKKIQLPDEGTFVSTTLTNDIHEKNSFIKYCSSVDMFGLTSNFYYKPVVAHNIAFGLNIGFDRVRPTIETGRYQYDLVEDFVKDQHDEATYNHDNTIGDRGNQTTIAVYAQDDWAIAKWLKANIGLRYSLYAVSHKAFGEIEPRLSMRVLMGNKWAFKLAYSRMSQSIHQLQSSNLVNPSDIWVPTTADIAPMTANQYAASITYEPAKGTNISVEGYYKTMKNLLEYREGASFMAMKDSWQRLVAMGDGTAYGVELFAQKQLGNTTGWIGYCWSKAYRTFDRLGQEINGGKRFYANNDRRNSINVMISHRGGKHWLLNASWTYITGRRGNISTIGTYTGMLDEVNPCFHPVTMVGGVTSTTLPLYGADGFVKYMQFVTYTERNGFILPAEHHLDVAVNYLFTTGRFDHTVTLSIYNLYNHHNVSNIYLGYNIHNLPVLRSVCKLPFMPSVSYTIKF